MRYNFIIELLFIECFASEMICTLFWNAKHAASKEINVFYFFKRANKVILRRKKVDESANNGDKKHLVSKFIDYVLDDRIAGWKTCTELQSVRQNSHRTFWNTDFPVASISLSTLQTVVVVFFPNFFFITYSRWNIENTTKHEFEWELAVNILFILMRLTFVIIFNKIQSPKKIIYTCSEAKKCDKVH